MAKIHAEAVAGDGVAMLQDVVAGAAADTNIALAGLDWGKAPRFVGVVNLTDLADGPAVTEIKKGTASSDIQFETTSTATKTLLITWLQKA